MDLKTGISKKTRYQRIMLAQTSVRSSTVKESQGLLVMCNGIERTAILDSWANCNIACISTLTKEQKKKINSPEFVIKLADGGIQRPVGIVHNITIEIGGQLIKLSFAILKDPGYELILGRQFLKFSDAKTYWGSDEYTFTINGRIITIVVPSVIPLEEEKEKKKEVRTITESNQNVEDTIKSIKTDYKNLFANSVQDISSSFVFQHTIETFNAKPTAQKLRRFPPSYQNFIDEQIKILLECVQIRESKSPWRANVAVVPKKNGSLRLCTDFRNLNDLTKKDRLNLPRIDEILDYFEGSTIFRTLDLFSGYWQIGIEPSSVEKIAFSTRPGHYEYLGMPFGLCNAPATFQRTMEAILRPILHISAVVYLDDITVFSKSLKQHEKDLRRCLELLKNAELKLNEKKCVFCQPKVQVLGFEISSDRVTIYEERLQRIREKKEPLNTKELQMQLGFFSYFRRFIPCFADLIGPLYDLLKKDATLKWSDSLQNVRNKTKRSLLKNATLTYPDFNEKFELHCDASAIAIGGILFQKGKIIACTSKKLTNSELNFSVTEKECFAIIYSLKKFRYYLLGRKFVIKSDHRCLNSIFKTPDPTERIARWILTFSEFEANINYLKGRQNIPADVLSRDIKTIETYALKKETMSKVDLLNLIIEIYEGKRILTEFEGKLRGKILDLLRKFNYKDGILWKKQLWKNDCMVILNEEEQDKIIQYYHSQGHFSSQVLFETIFDNYRWPKLYEQCKKSVQSCEVCQKCAPKKSNKEIGFFEASGLFESFHLDFVGPLKPSLNKNYHLKVAVERCSRLIIAKAVKEQTSLVATDFIKNEIIFKYGIPGKIISDKGSAFTSKRTNDFLKVCEILHDTTTAYNPSANGQVERYNGLIMKTITKLSLAKRTDWEQVLPLALYSLLIRKNKALGMSSYE